MLKKLLLLEKKTLQLETRTLWIGKFISKGKCTIKVEIHLHTNMMSKLAIARRGVYRCMILEMHLKWETSNLKQSCTYQYTNYYIKCHGNHKQNIYSSYTHIHTQSWIRHENWNYFLTQGFKTNVLFEGMKITLILLHIFIRACIHLHKHIKYFVNEH